MNEALLAGGVAVLASMTGCSANSSDAAKASASSGGPGVDEVEYDVFKGLATDGKIVADLYSIHSTSVSTTAVVHAAQAFLDGLSAKERRACTFDVDDDEWLAWSNVDGYEREGVRMCDITAARRKLDYALLGKALSADGLTQTRNVMKLKMPRRPVRPWGFQFDGHHVAINCFMLGDQVVMTPTLSWAPSRRRSRTRARRFISSSRRRRPDSR
ncbi:DUF3500 domain-containing protein [Streptomyces sp. SDT5-1]|uniref:DUF3500 domain-containing protein n=1 Tax=Streptomyces sp. SDT5-1 TaxID=3406418 RepID=UPI003FD52D9B